MTSSSRLIARPAKLESFPRPELINEQPGPEFKALLKKHKISDQEYAVLREIVGRAPTMTELGIFSSMWSEHCSYKSSRVHLKRLPTEGEAVVVGPGENAGVVRLSGKLCIAFKMESHNHPSYIEPYQGAATGVGGILRDVFCMGARPVANLNCLRFGRREHPRTHFLLQYVTKGIGDYGNCIGVPTVGGNVSFDQTYDGNCLVNAMTAGVIHEDRIFKGYASGPGNLVVYVGSATGRDGIHGATMASDSFATGESSERSTVQVGDPFTEKLLLEATLEALDAGLVVGLQDMGAAGLTSSSFEMADRAGSGIYLDLDRVPVRAKAMTAYELMLSESQERMLMVIEPDKWTALAAILERWQLAYDVIGVVTETGRVEIAYQGRLEVDVPVAPLTDKAPRYQRPMQPTSQVGSDEAAFARACIDRMRSVGAPELLKRMLADTGDKTPIYRQYDHHIGAKTVLGPEEQGAAVLWMRSDWADPRDEHLGLALATSCNERYCAVNPRLGGSHAVLKSAHMIAATGGRPLAVTDCLNFGNPEDPRVMKEFSDGVDGIADACRELSAPVVSGNVSLYNTTDGSSIAPTPMIGMVGRHDDVRKAAGAVATRPGVLAVLHPSGYEPRFGGSLAAKLLGLPLREGTVPPINWAGEREAMAFMQTTVARGGVDAARDVADGGLVAGIAKLCLKHGFGAKVELAKTALGAGIADPSALYFGEVSGTYVINFEDDQALETAMTAARELQHNRLTRIGVVTADQELRFDDWQLARDTAGKALADSMRI